MSLEGPTCIFKIFLFPQYFLHHSYLQGKKGFKNKKDFPGDLLAVNLHARWTKKKFLFENGLMVLGISILPLPLQLSNTLIISEIIHGNGLENTLEELKVRP